MDSDTKNKQIERLNRGDKIQLTLSISPDYIQGFKDDFKFLHQEISTLNAGLLKLNDLIANNNLNIRTVQESLNETLGQCSNKIDSIEEMAGNIDYNVRSISASNSGDGEYKQVLQSKLNEYEEDLHLKLMRKYVIDSHISIYIQIAEQLYIEHDEKLEKVLDLITEKLAAIGVKIISSKEGTSFDPTRMVTGHYTNILTDIEQLNGKVARSVTPAFIWSLPFARQQGTSLILREEDVILYKFNNNVMQLEKEDK